MEKKVIECVPNFSEGMDQEVIDKVTQAAASVEGIKVLSVESDKDYNRTVLTFVGNEKNIGEAAVLATQKCAELIDMTKQKGEHHRM